MEYDEKYRQCDKKVEIAFSSTFLEHELHEKIVAAMVFIIFLCPKGEKTADSSFFVQIDGFWVNERILSRIVCILSFYFEKLNEASSTWKNNTALRMFSWLSFVVENER